MEGSLKRTAFVAGSKRLLALDASLVQHRRLVGTVVLEIKVTIKVFVHVNVRTAMRHRVWQVAGVRYVHGLAKKRNKTGDMDQMKRAVSTM